MDSVQQDLNIFVTEYLEYCGCHKTVEVFNEELNEKSRPMGLSEYFVKSKYENPKKQLLASFESGSVNNFFKLWNDTFDIKNEDDIELIRLTFLLRVHFAIYPIKHDIKDTQGAMEALKEFLSAYGDVLSNSKETLSFFALPYVNNLKQHSSYKHLFNDEWANNLQRNLQDFLCNQVDLWNQPKLVDIYDFYQNANNNKSDSNAQFSYLLKDYDAVIQTTADLIELLETAARGNPITQQQVEHVTRKLFNEHVLKSTDITRPGTAAQTLRDSVALSHVENRKTTKPLKKHELDYKKINKDLAGGDDKKKCLLFHALKWNLIKSTPEDRMIILQEYLSHDILQCIQRQSKSLNRMLSGEDELVKLSFVQLLTALASFDKGKNYIAKKESMIEILIKSIQSQNMDRMTKECLLACLQRLSSRGNIQMLMIERNMIEWLVNELASNNGSPHILEYGVPLLTDLCLRTAGRNRCSEIADKILSLLSSMLQSDYNSNMTSCIIGTLYSILSVKSIKEEALRMGLLELLGSLKDSSDETIEKHKKYVINRLTSLQDERESGKEDDNDDEYEIDDEDDNDDGSILEEFLFHPSSPFPGDSKCEQMLISEYAKEDTYSHQQASSILNHSSSRS